MALQGQKDVLGTTGMPNQRKSFAVTVQLLPALGRLLHCCVDDPTAAALCKAARQLLTVGLFAEAHVAALRTLCTSAWPRMERHCVAVLGEAEKDDDAVEEVEEAEAAEADEAAEVDEAAEAEAAEAEAPAAEVAASGTGFSYQWQLFEVCMVKQAVDDACKHCRVGWRETTHGMAWCFLY